MTYTILKLAIFAVALLMTVSAQAQTITIDGNVFGGGCMGAVTNSINHVSKDADEASNTCTVDIYKGNIHGNIFGGNDITGDVRQPRYNDEGLPNANATKERAQDNSAIVNIHNTSHTDIKINEVYGGGNGYYTYRFKYRALGATSGEYNTQYTVNYNALSTNPNLKWLFTQKAPEGGLEVKVYPADATEYTDANLLATYTVPKGTSLVNVIPIAHNSRVLVGDAVLADNADDKILVKEVYGGAKMAWLSGEGGVTVNSGTINKAFAGNNFGGVVQTSSLIINGTKRPETLATTENFATFDWSKVGLQDGTGFGIGEAYGGGNAVDVNSRALLYMNDGYVGSLFGGNNLADMSAVPTVHLNGGNLRTVYGGGNAGKMKGCMAGAIDVSPYLDNTLFLAYDEAPAFKNKYNGGTKDFSTFCSNDSYLFFYGAETLVHQKSDATPLRINTVYGGCRAADVLLSTYVRMSKADYIGNMYGGCDISGSVAKGGLATGTKLLEDGTTYVTTAPMTVEQYNAETGNAHDVVKTVPAGFPIINLASMATMTAGTISGNIFAGGNGDYTYTEVADNKVEVQDANGTLLATINKTDYYRPWVADAVAALEGGELLGNLYGGGNDASVGCPAVGETPTIEGRSYIFLGKTPRGNQHPQTGESSAIYAGGKKSDIYGTVDVIVKAGCDINALYTGNDISGQVKGTNRTDFLGGAGSHPLTTPLFGGGTTYSGQPLTAPYGDADNLVQAYVRVEGADATNNIPAAKIKTLFGGGNGDYNYSEPVDGYVTVTSKDNSLNYGKVLAASANAAKPTQRSCWLDIQGDVETSYGGGNAAEVTNSNTYISANAHVGTAFGGGNAATVTEDVDLWVDCNGTTTADGQPDFEHPNVGTLYGGNNLADMNIVPRIKLWGGTIVTSYGGGNKGALKGCQPGALDVSAYLDDALFQAYGEQVHQFCSSDKYLYFYGAETLVEEKTAAKPLSVKNVYGGCRAANVDMSTYVRVTKPSYVGTVYGGCDIAGSVAKGNPSMPVTTKAMPVEYYDPNATDAAHAILKTLPQGFPIMNLASYITITDGTISGDCFAGGNGDYVYETDGTTTKAYAYADDGSKGAEVASFNNTVTDMPWVSNAVAAMEGGNVMGNIYGGGNNASVGTSTNPGRSYVLVGKTKRGVLATDATGPVCTGTIYAGGKKADVNGTVDMLVKAGSKVTTLYAGNDISGEVRGNNRGKFVHTSSVTFTTPLIGGHNTYNGTLLDNLHNDTDEADKHKCQTYVRIEGAGNDCDNIEQPAAYIGTLFGGGNGDYNYAEPDGGFVAVTSKDGAVSYGKVAAASIAEAKPVQESCWLDIKGKIGTSYGGGNAATVTRSQTYITGDAEVGTAFAGGNAATVTDEANLWLDCDGTRGTHDYVDETDDAHIPNVGTIFGGNNLADMFIVPKAQLYRGSVYTVYGGGNQGSMKGVRPYLVDMKEYISNGWFNGSFPLYSSDKVECFKGTNLVIDSPYGRMTQEQADAYNAAHASEIAAGTVKHATIHTPNGEPCKLIIGDIYAGCRAANVDNSSYVRVSHCDHVHNVYGGCDIAGSVGFYPGYLPSDSPYREAAKGENHGKVKFYYISSDDFSLHEEYRDVPENAPMVNPCSVAILTGGEVSRNVFGGGNGAYEYVENGNTVKVYPMGATQNDANMLAAYDKTKMTKPFTTVTSVMISGGTLLGNVYGGGNMAEVGHVVTAEDVAMHIAAGYPSAGGGYRLFPAWGSFPEHIVKAGDEISAISDLCLGRAETGRTPVVINGDVYGGGRMADVYGSMDIIALKDVNIGTLYAGNDLAGTVKGTARTSRFTPHQDFTTLIADENNRDAKLATSFSGETLTAENANTYIRIMPGATFEKIFGGGNGDYNYTSNGDGTVTIKSKDGTTTYGKVTATSVDAAKPFVHSSFVDIAGNAGTVYGGGNAADNEYTHVSIVGKAQIGTSATPGAVYGGCKSADVKHRARIYVSSFKEAGGTEYHPTVYGNVFGGCDISGNVGMGKSEYQGQLDITNPGDKGYSKVIINGGTITGRVFGGGNGLQSADGTLTYQTSTTPTILAGTAAPNESYVYADGTFQGKTLPQVENTWVMAENCTIGTTPGSNTHTIFGGGQGAGTRVIHNVDLLIGKVEASTNTTVKGISYGGSYAGFVNTDCHDHTHTQIMGYGTNTQVQGDIYGGSYGNYVRGEILVDINNIKVGVGENAAGIFAGNNAAAQPLCNACINYVGDDCNAALFGGGNKAPFYGTTRITFTKGSIGYIYGGGNHAPVYGNTIVEVLGGHVCHDVFGGGNNGDVYKWKNSAEHPTPNGADYGGNTLVIVRDDCLKVGADGNFVEEGVTGNYAANRDNTKFYSTYFKDNNDPYTETKQMYVLKPNDAGKKSNIKVDGNIYGGGNAADVEGKATVIIGEK